MSIIRSFFLFENLFNVLYLLLRQVLVQFRSKFTSWRVDRNLSFIIILIEEWGALEGRRLDRIRQLGSVPSKGKGLVSHDMNVCMTSVLEQFRSVIILTASMSLQFNNSSLCRLAPVLGVRHSFDLGSLSLHFVNIDLLSGNSANRLKCCSLE